MVRDPSTLEPGAPEACRRGDPRVGFVAVLRRHEPVVPRERAEGAVAGLEHMAGAHTVLLDTERQVGLQPDRDPGSGCVGDVSLVPDQGPLGLRSPVVEGGLADELDLDLACEALDGAYEQVIGVVVGGGPRVRSDRVFVPARAHGQRVADDDPAVRRPPCRFEHVRSRLVDNRSRMIDPERREAEEAGFSVEQAAENAGRVEAGHAEPVDRPVRGDERAGVAVREKRVLRDRRERRRGGRALRLPLGCGFDGGHDVTQGSCRPPYPQASLSAALSLLVIVFSSLGEPRLSALRG